jgi:hypothetical protein
MVLLACAGLAMVSGSAAAADGGHLPGFSLMNRKVSVANLPFVLQSQFRPFTRHPPIHGPLWFGEVKRPNATLYAAGVPKWVCDFVERQGGPDGGGGTCASLGSVRAYGLLSVESCGQKRPTHFRVTGMVPDGVTGLAVKGPGGVIVATEPVVDNTVSFTLGRQNVTLHGIGNPEAEGLERRLPLATAGKVSPGGCTSYGFPGTPAT